MLGKRSRPNKRTESKSLMSDNPSDRLDTGNRPTNKSSAFYQNSRLLIGLNSKIGVGLPEDGLKSPTSPLDIKSFSGLQFWQENKQPRSPRPALEGLQYGPKGWEKRDSEGIGLGIVAALHNSNDNSSCPSPKGSECRICSTSRVKILVASGNPQSPLHNDSRGKSQPIPIGPGFTKPPSMEYSESYTCVTSHGPKSITKQIYAGAMDHDAVVEKPPKCTLSVFSASPPSSYRDVPEFPTADFLSACYLCRRPLSPGKDIYMYRGDKAFCSVECRYQQIAHDERKERCASEAMKHTSSTSSSPHRCRYQGRSMFTTSTLAAA